MTQETITQQESQVIRASFQQKSVGVSLFITGSTAAYYFAQAWPMRPAALAGANLPDGYRSLVFTTLGIIVLAQIVLQIVLVIGAGSDEKPTPRDKEASRKARRNAYGVFAAGVLAIIMLPIMDFPAFCIINMAMLTLLLAEITRFASQLIYGRRAG